MATNHLYFPLYENIKDRIRREGNITFDINYECTKINEIYMSMSVEERTKLSNCIYLIIFHHKLTSNVNSMYFENTPYKGEMKGYDVIYDIRNIPQDLQRIIFTLVNCYI